MVAQELGPQLSPLASIITEPGAVESDFERWSAYSAPQPGVVVSVATEEDVAKTVWIDPPLICQPDGGGNGLH